MPVYRTTGAWGAGQGFNLTAAQVDGNFYELRSDLDDLIANPLTPDEISSITASGTTMTVTLQSGAQFAVPFPILQFRWRDDWTAFTPYAAFDAFKVDGVGIFSVLQDHTSAATFDPDATGGSPASAFYNELIAVTGADTPLGGLADTDFTSAGDNDFIAYDLASTTWTNRTPTAATALLDEFVGDAASPSIGGTKGLVPAPSSGDGAAQKILKADGTWGAIPLDTLSDVDASGPTDGQLLAYSVSAGGWIAADVPGVSNTLGSLTDIVFTGSPAPIDGQALVYDADTGKWTNADNGITAITGDVTATGPGSALATLANSGVTPGSYSNATIAVDAKGRITAASNGSATINSGTMDSAFGSTRGSILYRGSSGWTILTPGTSGQILEAQGAGADPHWATVSGISNTFAGLTDVTISGPAASNFIVYDLGTSKWVNRTHVQATAVLDAMVGDSGSGGTKGLVPAPGSGDAAAAKFLKADGTWAVPAGGSATPGGSSNSIQYNNSGAFGGLGPLTDGQLVIGDTGGAPVAAALTAGTGISITNGAGSITIAASGSGGSGLYGPVMGTLPTQSNTGLSTWVNQGSSTVADDVLGVVITSGSIASSDLSGLVKTPPATPYTVTALLVVDYAFGTSSPGWALGFRDSGTGKLHVIHTQPTNILVDKWSAANTFVASDAAPSTPAHIIYGPAWVQIADDGTNVSFRFSFSGGKFFTVFTVAKASGYLGSSGYNQIFFGFRGNGAVMYATLMAYIEA